MFKQGQEFILITDDYIDYGFYNGQTVYFDKESPDSMYNLIVNRRSYISGFSEDKLSVTEDDIKLPEVQPENSPTEASGNNTLTITLPEETERFEGLYELGEGIFKVTVERIE